MTKEALKLALEALESCDAAHITDGGRQWYDEKLVDKAITAIKEALAQPEQPKVRTGNCLRIGVCASEGHKIAPQRKPLTDEEIDKIWVPHTFIQATDRRQQAFARAIEAAHGIGGEA